MGGTAIIFVPLLALAAGSLFVVLVFASHYFLTLVECVAHGQRAVDWPKEAFLEWLGKPVHLGWLAGLYLLPATLLASYIGRAAGTPYVTLALTALAFALLFPFGALSAFIARSVWVPFHPRAIVLLMAKPVATLGFFAIGFVACLVGLIGGFLAMFSDQIGSPAALIIGSILAALAWFVYACALGRLLFAVTYVAPPRKKRRKGDGGRRKSARDTPPSAVPPPPLKEEVPFWERPKPAWDPDRDETPYAAHAAETVAKEHHAELVKPKESEITLISREPPPAPPENPWNAEAFAPMTQNETMRNAMILAIMVAIESGLVRALLELNPTR